jgi:hypothetical protein
MPSEGPCFRPFWTMRLMPNITHELQPGEMHCNMRNMRSAHFPSVSSRPTTYREEVAPGNLLAWRVARWHRCHFPPEEMYRNLLGQNFQPCCWTRCFNSEEPSHECSGPLETISCWHALHHIYVQPSMGQCKFRASLNASLSK